MTLLYTEESTSIALDVVDLIEGRLNSFNIQITDEQRNKLENEFYEYIVKFIELEYGRLEYKHHL